MTEILVAKAVVIFGLAIWSTLIVVNNVQGFKGATGAVGRTMAMTLLDTAPALPTPLKARRIADVRVHRAAMALLLLAQIAIALLFWRASLAFLFADVRIALDRAVMALAAFAAEWMGFNIGGLWFGYWFRQESLHQTHIALLVLAIAGILLMRA